ncbi:MAG: hypothetical protein NTZ14_01670, partial [Hyphomicrobiales bacterium]|nr:hypothetical protein [Hyphomicrobiales bacterium]
MNEIAFLIAAVMVNLSDPPPDNRLATPSWIKSRRFRCRANVNCFMTLFMILFMILLRRRVGRCAFSARLL